MFRHLIPLGMSFLCGNGVLLKQLASHYHSLGEHSKLIAMDFTVPQWWFGQGPSLTVAQTMFVHMIHMDRVFPELAQSHCPLLPEVRQLSTWEISDTFTPYLSKRTQVSFDL